MENKAFNELRDRYREIELKTAGTDSQETAEREAAALAYSAENEKHFTDYLHDCVTTSREAAKEIREVQYNCYRVFQEKEPLSYNFKEEWQSRTVVPKPFSSVMYGAASVKRAFSPEFLTIEHERNKKTEIFWKRVLGEQLDNRHARFVTRFVDATIMALATGQSSEIIPRYVSGKGLSLDLVEPWKISRDPDAPPRDPQGGLYWIHQEWLDYHVLLQAEAAGTYQNVARVKDVGRVNPDDPMMTQEAIARRREQTWSRSKFRNMVLVSEFWGTVLSPSGEELLPLGWYTTAGNRLVAAPRKSPYQWLRWPGISFSTMPDLLAYGGRGLLQGVMSLWESLCNLMCLHEDGLKFLVNPPTEINTSALVDPLDVDDWPGKKYLVRDTIAGQQAVRSVDRRDPTSSILANMQYYDQLFQRGTTVTDAVQGLPGYRAEITARESAQNLDQAMGVFGLMGANLEDGAVTILSACLDVLQTFAPADELAEALNPKERLDWEAGSKTIPELTGNFSISGMQELLRQADTLRYLTQYIFPMAENPLWGRYLKPYAALKAFEARTNLKDEDVLVSEEEAAQIDKAGAGQAPGDAPAGPPGNPTPPVGGGALAGAPLEEQKITGPKTTEQ